MKFCSNCGAQLADEALFCGECGSKVSPTSEKQQDYHGQHPYQPGQQGSIQQHEQQSYLQQQAQQAYNSQPIQQGYPQQPIQQGYPQQPVQQGYPQQPIQQGYPQQPVQQGYPQQPVQQGYHQQPVQQGCPQQPIQQGYPQQPIQQGYPQQPIQQGYPVQGYIQRPIQPEVSKPVFIQPEYPEGTPLLSIVWKGTEGSIDGLQNWVNKKIMKNHKSSYLNVYVNGKLIAPTGYINYYESFQIDIPITQDTITVEIRNGKAQSGDIHTFVIDPSQSYVLEIFEPSILASSKIYGCILFDKENNLIASSGDAPKNRQWMSLLIPLIGIYFGITTEEANQNKSIKKLYILTSLTNLVIVVLILIRIFSD